MPGKSTGYMVIPGIGPGEIFLNGDGEAYVTKYTMSSHDPSWKIDDNEVLSQIAQSLKNSDVKKTLGKEEMAKRKAEIKEVKAQCRKEKNTVQKQQLKDLESSDLMEGHKQVYTKLGDTCVSINLNEDGTINFKAPIRTLDNSDNLNSLKDSILDTSTKFEPTMDGYESQIKSPIVKSTLEKTTTFSGQEKKFLQLVFEVSQKVKTLSGTNGQIHNFPNGDSVSVSFNKLKYFSRKLNTTIVYEKDDDPNDSYSQQYSTFAPMKNDTLLMNLSLLSIKGSSKDMSKFVEHQSYNYDGNNHTQGVKSGNTLVNE